MAAIFGIGTRRMCVSFCHTSHGNHEMLEEIEFYLAQVKMPQLGFQRIND